VKSLKPRWLPKHFCLLLFVFTAATALPQLPESVALLIDAAIERTSHEVVYDPAYRQLDYPGGDIPDSLGVCTDLIIRCYRVIGIDLQQEIHQDMSNSFQDYPVDWGLSRPDRNIDHRRVPNLQTYLRRQGAELPVSDNQSDYLPGDLVTWLLHGFQPHIGIVVDSLDHNGSGPLIAHNIGRGPELEAMLFDFPVTGHYRFFR